MASLDRLAPDQRAALTLILQQGQSYDELADLLATDASTIRARAHAAVEVVAAEITSGLDAAQRGEISDYMLGQQTYSQRQATREWLSESPDARAWARAVGAELRPLMSDEPPGVPSDGTPETVSPPAAETLITSAGASALTSTTGDSRSSRPGSAADTSPTEQDVTAGGEPGARGAGMQRTSPGSRAAPPWAPPVESRSSRRGGIVLILLAAAVLVVGIVLLANSGGSSTTPTSSSTFAPSSASTGASGPQGAPRVQVIANVPLSAADGSAARGAAEVVQQPGTTTRAFLIAGTRLRPSSASNAYAVWLYNSPTDAASLGFFAQTVGRGGQLEGTAAVPANVDRYAQLIVTRETTSRPTRPGAIILRGALKLPAG